MPPKGRRKGKGKGKTLRAKKKTDGGGGKLTAATLEDAYGGGNDYGSDSEASDASELTVMGGALAALDGQVDSIEDLSEKFNDLVEDLTEKRYTTREKALAEILILLCSGVRADLLDGQLETIISDVCSCAKRGKGKESSLASRVLALISITLGADRDDIFGNVEAAMLQVARRGKSDAAKAEAIYTLATICFVSSTDEEASWRTFTNIFSMFARESLGAGVASMKKPAAPAVLEAAALSWGLLATTVPRNNVVGGDAFEAYTSKLHPLLFHGSLPVRAAAGQAAALLYEFAGVSSVDDHGDIGGSDDDEEGEDQGAEEQDQDQDQGDEDASVKSETIGETIARLATEYNRYKSKKERKEQRYIFRDILQTVHHGERPEISLTISGESIAFTSWTQIFRLNMLKRALSTGFQAHFSQNSLIRDIFMLGPPQEMPTRLSSLEKRKYMSKNSAASKELTLDRKFDRTARSNMKNAFLNADQ